MVKIRLEGLPEEIDAMVQSFSNNYEVLNVSKPYKNRGETKYVRVYVEMSLK